MRCIKSLVDDMRQLEMGVGRTKHRDAFLANGDMQFVLGDTCSCYRKDISGVLKANVSNRAIIKNSADPLIGGFNREADHLLSGVNPVV